MKKEMHCFNKPLTWSLLNQKISELMTDFPFIQKRVIGHSVLGKEIVELHIGSGSQCVHYNASFHGNEWITTLAVMRFLYEYALHYEAGRTAADVSLSLVPMVNPDGVDLVLEGSSAAQSYEAIVLAINNGSDDFSRWKANIRGVDLNKQFPAGWEIEASRKPKQPHYRDYPGAEPLTEPEAEAMVQLMKRNAFVTMHAVHTQGEEIYWGFNSHEPEESKEIVHLYAEESGYEAVCDIDNYAGFKDWYLQEFHKPAFTLELGHGVNPLPLSQLEEIYSKCSKIFKASVKI